MTGWTVLDMPSQQGRTAVVTGTGGLAYQDALALARAGADVILAGRNPAKGARTVARIRDQVPGAAVRFETLDLADLASVAAFGARLRAASGRLDLLINNAGVMTPPRRGVTADGFELQLGTNYLGHFALTAQLLPLLRQGRDARVVHLSSLAANDGVIDFDNLGAERGYQAMKVYNQSKLACLMFALELQRRSDAAGWGLRSVAAHPGLARTEIVPNGAGWLSPLGLFRVLFARVLFQSAARGALPTLYAATAPQAGPGAYYGPDGFQELRGAPAGAKMPPRALDAGVAARLWQVSEHLTGARFG